MISMLLARCWADLVGRLDGPLAFRFILQPVAAAILAILAGWNDAQTARPALGWIVLTDPIRLQQLLREGWREIQKVFVAAVIIDLAYEIIVFRAINPGQSLIMAAVLALLPYVLLRSPFNRLAWRWHRVASALRANELSKRGKATLDS